ncbi:MAG: trans-sulfuration enzyme family protein, partial [Candidatus Rokuibacteriota bacterium]
RGVATKAKRKSAARGRHPQTDAIHLGERRDPTGALMTPIYQTSTFRLGEKEYAALDKNEYDDVFIYTRWQNPSLDVPAKKIAALERTDRALLFGSGMGAISASVLANLEKGDRLVASRDLYGGTIPLFNHLPRFGIDVVFVDQTDVEEVAAAASDKRTKVIYVETITNPLLRIAPLPELAKVAREAGAELIVDNTFASPVNCRPAEHGASVIVESCTKYLGGHSDIVAGVSSFPERLKARMWEMSIRLGATLDPHAAFLLNRGLKTVHLRVRRHDENAVALAGFLQDVRGVRQVIYPGLKDHAQRSLASRLLDGFGGMLTFVVDGGDAAARRVMDSLEIVSQAPSLGSVESLITMPVSTSHVHVPPAHRKKMGILPGMLRLSVGTEDVEDLKADLASALQKA